ncbi:GPI mannosyltransferase 2 [Coccidioides immitis RS]|nr:GPI mannosyltransferase 2 [Coccidioides immitis RS]EAS36187.3 GPI mannosyltransferase 2 [Coccidioides immitis RS]KMP01513.1 GPI mannosyltransferase 2 [Coccidioides immitis RMSCC 2394]TPX25665.1 ER membrane glycoprotein subunit of the GPI transamidase complex-like protein [Coccidioides immitis]
MTAHPVRTLTLWFCLWKFLLLAVMLASPGPGYDTSTTILSPTPSASQSASFLKLARWDSIYFLNVAQRGYLYEQEWAWGYGYTKLLSALSAGTPREVLHLALVGIGLSHICHYLSVLLLYGLSKAIFGERHKYGNSLPFLSAALHIVCPAGAFLSAPYSEALFSFLNFLGFYVYVQALKDDRSGSLLVRDLKFVAAGCVFALATTVRSNGILSGMLFAYDATLALVEIIQARSVKLAGLRRLTFVVLGGAMVLVGAVGPQYLAYSLYCQPSASPREWCVRLFPSIYTWVQSYYWNVGFLRYWTISNIPLFLIAGPMLFILFYSSGWAVSSRSQSIATDVNDEQPKVNSENGLTQACLARLALPQATLALLALTSYHVQIINRIASGYPLWYWWLASSLLREGKPGFRGSRFTKPGHVLCGMVLYGVIQASLFASFLPPA